MDRFPNDPQFGYLELFDSFTALDPDRVSILDADEQVSYLHLKNQAAVLAAYLQSLDLPEDALIGICLPRQPLLIAALLAVHAAGYAYVPIDPGFPAERSRFALEDAEAAVLISTTEFAESVAPATLKIVLLDEQWSKIKQTAASAGATSLPLQHQEYRPDRLAYVIYTSGSTGQPKGVRVTCGNLSNFLQSMRRCPGLEAGHRVLALTTVAFDIAQLELFLPLISGATICLATREVSVDGFALAEFMETHSVTHAQATPSTWRLLQATGWSGNRELTALCGGEALNPELAGWLQPRVKALWNMYGPTETTVWSSCGLINEKSVVSERISIGQAIDNTSLYLRRLTENETDWQLCDVDEPGELLIGGLGVADGYHNRRELSAKQFIDNPFDRNNSDSPVLYCTGDLVSVDATGNYNCHGRIDNQIKLRGFRIEPGEIESVIEQHEAVSSAAVVLHAQNNSEHLTAYLVTPLSNDDELAGLLLDIQEAVAAKLPAYMTPQVYARLDEMPLTPNAKLDRKALPSPDSEEFHRLKVATDHGDSGLHQPCGSEFTEKEKEVANLWCELTGQSVHDSKSNFFESGGHSLLAMKFIANARNIYSVQLPLRCLSTENLSQIAARLDGTFEQESLSVDARTTTSRSDGYIENGRRRVFYQIHEPLQQPSLGAVLIVPPIAHESMRLHRELFLLAESLAVSGLTAMRFDLSASGHSAMNTNELEFNDWLEDVRDAAEFLCTASNHTTVDFVGVRGAALLMKQPESSNDQSFALGRLVLWDPVFSGAEHVRELQGLTAKVLRDLDRFRWRITTSSDQEIMGQVYTTGFIKTLSESVFADADTYIPGGGQHIVASQSHDVSRLEQAIVVGGENIPAEWQIHRMPGSIEWQSVLTVDAPVVAPDSIDTIRSLLT